MRIDEDVTLLDDGKTMYQKKDGFRFGIDAVVLAGFFEGKIKGKVLEVGTGTGIIPILLCQRGYMDIKALEIQKDMAELARRNISLNGLEDRVEIINTDVKALKEGNTYDYVISNPPYMKIDGKKLNDRDEKTIARHEINLSLEELIVNAKRLLKPRGSITVVHRAYRLGEILIELEKNGFSTKRIQSVYPTREVDARLVLVEASKGRKESLRIEDGLYIDER